MTYRHTPKSLAYSGFILAIGLTIYSCTYEQPQPAIIAPVKKSQTQIHMERHIAPQTAEVICRQAKRPRTMAAIAAVESGKTTNTSIRGDHGKSKGLWQVQAHHWQDVIGSKEVSDDLETQLRQSEAVLDTLIQVYGYREGIRRYNGTGAASYRYQAKVLQIASRL